MEDVVEDLAVKVGLLATSSSSEEDLGLVAASSEEEDDLRLAAASSSEEDGDLRLAAASSEEDEDYLDIVAAWSSDDDESSGDELDRIIWREVQQITDALERGEKPDMGSIMGIDCTAKAQEWDIVEVDGKRMERVKQSYIDKLRARPPRSPLPPVDHARFDRMRLDDPEGAEERRAAAVYHFNLLSSSRDFTKDILAQYEATGTAYIPIDDDEYEEICALRGY